VCLKGMFQIISIFSFENTLISRFFPFSSSSVVLQDEKV